MHFTSEKDIYLKGIFFWRHVDRVNQSGLFFLDAHKSTGKINQITVKLGRVNQNGLFFIVPRKEVHIRNILNYTRKTISWEGGNEK